MTKKTSNHFAAFFFIVCRANYIVITHNCEKKILECGTGFLNRRHFEFYHGDAPCFKFDILNLNFPPFLCENCKKVFFCCLPGSNPGPSSCGASMLPQDHQVWCKLGGKIQQYNHMWREIQIEYVELEERGIPMVKFLFWMFNLAVPNSSTYKYVRCYF